MFTRTLLLICISAVLFFSFGIAQGKDYAQSQSLTGLETVKIYFDVNVGNPKKLVLRLSLIDKTLSQLKAAGVKPEVVIAFRGKASQFITSGTGYVEEEEKLAKAEVHEWLETFAKEGVHMEQCLMAADLQGINPEDFRAEVEVTQNGYISMIAYQNRGFSLVPMD